MDRVVVIRLTALGDVVLVEPVARALKAAFPGVAVDLITDVRSAPALADRGSFDRVIAYDRRGLHRGFRGMSQLIRSLPAIRYRAVIDLQGKLRTRILARRISAERRLTLQKRGFLEALRSLVGRDPPITDRHSVDLYLAALAPLGIAAGSVDRRPQLAARSQRLQDSLQIGLGIGTTHATKRWPPERFVELGLALIAVHPGATLIPIAGPQDRAVLDFVRAALPKERLDPRDVAALDVAGLTVLIEGLDLLVGVDSGPAHLAAALGVPVVVLFGPTSPDRWGPIGAPHKVVTLGLPCAPCSNTGSALCPLPDHSHRCMRDLSVDRVAAAAQEILRT